MSIITKEMQQPVNQQVTAVKEEGTRAQKLFKSIILTNFAESGLSEEVQKLFPIDKLVSCELKGSEFTVIFQSASTAIIEKSTLSPVVGAKFTIPQTVKGNFEIAIKKIAFPDSNHAISVKPNSIFTPSCTLYGVQYNNKNESFDLALRLTTMTVPRRDFQAAFQNYKFT